MTFAAPMRVNREAGSAIAAGNIRGAQLPCATGRRGRGNADVSLNRANPNRANL
jgi:hypothetical protein